MRNGIGAATIVVAVGILGAAAQATAAPGDHVWSKGWSVNGVGSSVDGAGGVGCAGTFSGTVDFGGGTLTATGLEVFVAKFNGGGTHIWSDHYPPESFVTVTAVACAPAGDIYVAGNLPKGGTIDFGGGPIGLPDGNLWAVRFDPQGNHVWSDTFGFGTILDIDATDTAVAFAARNSSIVNFGGANLGASGNIQTIVAKLTPSKTHVWSQAYGDAAFQTGREVGLLPSGELVLMSAVQGTVDFGLGALVADTNDDITLARFNGSGGCIWSQIRHGSFGTFGVLNSGMDVSPTGEIAIAGEFIGTADLGGGTLTSTLLDIFVARYNSGGTHTFSTKYGTSTDEAGQSIWFDPSGNVVLAGTYSSAINFGGGNLPFVGSKDIFLASFESDGTHLWSRGWGTSGNESRCEAEVGPNGEAILSATGSSGINFGGGAITPASFYLAEIQGTAGGSVDAVTAEAPVAAMHVAPNPFTTTAAVRFAAPAEGAARLEVMDVAGRRVRSLDAGSGPAGNGTRTVVWDGRDERGQAITPGVYFVRLATNAGTQVERVVHIR